MLQHKIDETKAKIEALKAQISGLESYMRGLMDARALLDTAGADNQNFRFRVAPALRAEGPSRVDRVTNLLSNPDYSHGLTSGEITKLLDEDSSLIRSTLHHMKSRGKVIYNEDTRTFRTEKAAPESEAL